VTLPPSLRKCSILTWQSRRILTLFNIYSCFPNAITSFQSHQNAQSFFRVLICFKTLAVERKEENNSKLRWPLEYSAGKPVKFPRACRMMSYIRPINIQPTDWVSFWIFHSSFETGFEKWFIESNNYISNEIVNLKFYSMGLRLTWLDCKADWPVLLIFLISRSLW